MFNNNGTAEVLIFDCKQLQPTQNPKDYIKYEIDTSSKTFRQIFKYSNKENPITEKNVSEGGLIDSEFIPAHGFIYQYTDYLDATYGFDYVPGDVFIDYDRTNPYNTKPSMKCVREEVQIRFDKQNQSVKDCVNSHDKGVFLAKSLTWKLDDCKASKS